MTESIQAYKRKKDNKKKRRITILSIVLMCALLLSGCGFENGGEQFTKLDTRYLQTTPSAVPQQNATDAPKVGVTAASETEWGQAEKSEDSANKKNASADEKQSNKKSQSENKTNSNKSNNTKNSSQKKKSSKKTTTKKATSSNSNTKKDKNSSTSDSSQNKTNSNSATTPLPDSDAATNKETCTISIDCKVILSNMDALNSAKKSFVPKDGIILKSTKVEIETGDSVYDILNRVCRKYKIHMEAAYTPAYKTYYVEGINQLYEFDCGNLSGWTFFVNGKSANYGASKYKVNAGDVIQWQYTCDAGRDVNA